MRRVAGKAHAIKRLHASTPAKIPTDRPPDVKLASVESQPDRVSDLDWL
jgi:hypothetical protein